MQFVVWLVAPAVVILLSMLALRWYYVYRAERVAEIAERLGLSFWPTEGVFEELSGLFVTRTGDNPRVRDCIAGNADGTHVRIFEYCCTFGDVAAPASHTVVLLACDELDAPQLLVRPKHRVAMLDPYAQLAPGPILIRGDFDKKWIATGEDRQAVRSLFDDALIEFVESNKWWIEAHGSRLALYRWNHTVNHASLESFLRQAFEALLLLKARCPAAASDTMAEVPEAASSNERELVGTT